MSKISRLNCLQLFRPLKGGRATAQMPRGLLVRSSRGGSAPAVDLLWLATPLTNAASDKSNKPCIGMCWLTGWLHVGLQAALTGARPIRTWMAIGSLATVVVECWRTFVTRATPCVL